MTGLCGWFGGSQHQPNEVLAQMLKPLGQCAPLMKQSVGANWAVGTATLRERLAFIHVRPGLTVVLIGHPKIDGGSANPAEAFATNYLKNGEAALASLSGPFTAVVIDEAQGRSLVGIDRMGVHSVTYAEANGVFVFGTSCDSIIAYPEIRAEINPQAIYDYLYFHMVPAPLTIYRGYQRLLPGQYVVFEKGRSRTGNYWSMHFDESQQEDFGPLKEQFLSTLRQAVRDAADGATTGSFLSGGTDSSTMSGLLSEVTGQPARTYSIGFDEPGYDEMDYARIAAKHFRTDHHEYYVTPDDIVSLIPRLAGIYDQPFGNSSAVPTYYCARMAQADGIERLIGGDGGDELFGGNERYAKQYVFSHYEKIPASLRKGVISPIVKNLPGSKQFTIIRKAKSYVEQASVPMPARLETYNLLDRIGQDRILTPEFRDAIDTTQPLRHLENIYNEADAKSQINRMLALDFRVTLADNDLPKVVNTCTLAGTEVTFPMLSDAVVAFSAKLAPELKLNGTKLRYFFKEALRGFLPDEIITKQKHGFGLPFGPWLTKHKPLQTLVFDSLNSLKASGIIRPAFIDELTSQHLNAHASYYGTMVWVLVMLELWLQKQTTSFRMG